MKVRVCEICGVAAASAFSAGSWALGAQQELSDPQCKPLFAYPSRAVEEKAGGKAAGFDAMRESTAKCFVAVKVHKGHC